MSTFDDIISESEEQLVQRLYKSKDTSTSGSRITDIGASFKLRKEQLICATGFNPNAKFLTEIHPILGYATFNDLTQDRNDIFTSDIYKYLSLDNVLKIFDRIKDEKDTLEVMQYLLKSRLEKVEHEIESTVNSLIIEKYKAEMRAIYNCGIANIEFAEDRLDKNDSGFRALLNEVIIIVECKLIPAGEIFFRDTILPQEKQKLLSKGFIPKDLIQSRLNDEGISADEKKY